MKAVVKQVKDYCRNCGCVFTNFKRTNCPKCGWTKWLAHSNTAPSGTKGLGYSREIIGDRYFFNYRYTRVGEGFALSRMADSDGGY